MRIYTPQPLYSGAIVALDAEAQHYVAKVLRLGPGDAIQLFNGDGREYGAQLRSVDRSGAIAVLHERPPKTEPASPLRIKLLQCVAKGERTDWIIQKSVELGMAKLTLILCKRGMVKLTTERRAGRYSHWWRVLISACEQSGRSYVPDLQVSASVREALAEDGNQGTSYLLDPQAGACLAGQNAPRTGEIALFVGPEGGLSSTEQTLARDSGFLPVRLGPRILRTETAPLAAIATIQALWGDFRE